MSNEQTDWTTEGYQAFSNGLNGITETSNATKYPPEGQNAECDHLDNFQQFLEYMEENDDPSPLSQVHWWLLHKRFTDNNYCGKCGVRLDDLG